MKKLSSAFSVFVLFTMFSQTEAKSIEIDHSTSVKFLKMARHPASEVTAAQKRSANRIAKKGFEAYGKYDYKKSADLFYQSLLKYPQLKKVYLAYGLSLFEIEKYEPAKAFFAYIKSYDKKKSDVGAYYLALTYYKQGEYEKAVEEFEFAKKSKDKELAAVAYYYSGQARVKTKDYLAAAHDYREARDHTDKPELKKDSVDGFRQAAKFYLQKARKDKKWRFSGLIGTMYDSNILFTPDNSVGINTDEDGYRWLVTGSARYRFYRDEETNREWALQASSTYLTSFNPDHRRSDPFVISISAPYRHPFKLWGKDHRFSATPVFETLYLDANTDRDRENILSAGSLTLSDTIIMNDKWSSVYSLSFRNDNSYVDISSSDDDSSAKRYTLGMSQRYFLNAKKGRILTGNLSYTGNDADGKNNNYNRIAASLTYSSNLPWWKLSTSLAVNWFNISFDDRTDNRDDDNIGLSWTLSRPITNWATGILQTTYNDNESNVASFTYERLVVMTAVSFDGLF